MDILSSSSKVKYIVFYSLLMGIMCFTVGLFPLQEVDAEQIIQLESAIGSVIKVYRYVVTFELIIIINLN